MSVLNLPRLTTLRAVIAAGSVHAAATNLGYTPSAISQQLHTLQRQTGLHLVERAGRGIRPTTVGRVFATEAGALLEQAARLEGLVADLRAGRTGSLLLRHAFAVGVAWIPAIVTTLTREFPDLRLDLRLTELSRTGGDEPDVAVDLQRPGAGGLEGYETEHLLTDPYLVVLPSGHALAGREEVALADLVEQPWIDNEVADAPARQILLDACTANGFTPSFRLETQDYGVAVAFVEAGAGITVMPQLSLSTVRTRFPGIAVARLVDPEPTCAVVVRSRSALARNPALQRMLELLRASAARHRG